MRGLAFFIFKSQDISSPQTRTGDSRIAQLYNIKIFFAISLQRKEIQKKTFRCMTPYEECVACFRYDNRARSIFPYIDEYANRMDAWLGQNIMDAAQQIRYMLVGMFLHYRASNHHGNSFTTEFDKWHNLEGRPEARRKLELLNESLGGPITSTQEYLQLIKLDNLAKSTGIGLFNFVVTGDY